MGESSRGGFSHDTTAVEVLEGIDLDGKLALVTGASGGLGAETAQSGSGRLRKKWWPELPAVNRSTSNPRQLDSVLVFALDEAVLAVS
jgi:hypothetical protein